MCGLFGFVDSQHILTAKQKNALLLSLAVASEVRGTDATGIAYNDGEKLQVYKRPWAGRYMRFRIPRTSCTVMGHTRLATQGSAQANYNNHPFIGETGGHCFALAHNGVIHNDAALRENLPETPIETDSYVAVQLIEQNQILNADSLKSMAEKVRGSFTFTILDNANSIWIIKGDCPFCLYYFPANGLYIYASTESILLEALSRIKSRFGKPKKVPLLEGDILKIAPDGTLYWDKFCLPEIPDPAPWEWPRWPFELGEIDSDLSYIQSLKSVAATFGFSPEAIESLLEKGYTSEEIEQFLYCIPNQFH